MSVPKSIYGLGAEWAYLLRCAEQCFDDDGVEIDTDEGLDSALAALGDDIVEKLGGCGFVLRRLRAENAAIAAEEKRLAAIRKRGAKAIERFEDRIKLLMVAAEDELKARSAKGKKAGTCTAKVPGMTITLAAASEQLSLTGPVPEQWMSKPITPAPEPMRNDIKAALKKGVRIPGALLVPGNRGLRIT